MRLLLRRGAGLLAALLATVGVLIGVAPSAQAARTVTFDRYDIDYVFGTDGSAQVTETVVARWGVGAGRHGIDRFLITREEYFGDDSLDALHPIDNVSVTSPDAGVSTAFTLTETTSDTNPRNAFTRIRIGDADRTITAPTATYVISYRQRGLTQAAADYDAINLDVLSDMGTVRSATVTITVPGGSQGVDCWAAPVSQRTPCTSKSVVGGVATFTQAPLAEEYVLTVATQVTKGAITAAGPILVESAVAERERLTRIGQVGGLAGALLVPVLGFFYYRPRTRDDRFAGMPPGTFPRADTVAAVEPNRLREVPVSFAPPRLPLMHAGYLLEGDSRIPHLTATLVGLATAGAIQLSSGAQDEARPVAIPKNRAAVPDAPSELLFDGLFGGSGEPVLLNEAGSMEGVRADLYADAERTARDSGWFRRLAVGRRSGVVMGVLMVWLAVTFFGGVSDQWASLMLWVVVPIVIAWVITRMVAARFLKRGQRSAAGRAWTDQIEGFRTYIATAEAEQLRFNEGEDLFTRYLPWAILFGLAERWTQVCERAVELGIMQQPDTYWFGGGAWDAHWLLWNLHTWDDSLASAAAPLPDVSSGPSFSNTDFGGGTGFGGGGGDFAGGGFGGGGADGW